MDLNLPRNCLVNKFIPKSKFFSKTAVSTKIRDDFTGNIQKITWKYKLSPETLSIPAWGDTEEIQIFEIELKEKVIPQNVLRVIDKLIPYPILYVLIYDGHLTYGISLKNDPSRSYYFSEWDEIIEFNFHNINLEKIYQGIIKKFIKYTDTSLSNFQEIVATEKKINTLSDEIQMLKNKIQGEKQFKKKLSLNTLLREKQSEQEKLKNTNIL
jgi:hypothetical protein